MSPFAGFTAALRFLEPLILVAVFLQTAELLAVRGYFGKDGVFDWREIRREFGFLPRPFRILADLALGNDGFRVLLLLRCVVAVVGLAVPHFAVYGFLWVTTLLICVRFRGTYNGGSDYMTFIVLGGATVATAYGRSDPRATAISLGYVALQVCLSYFIAGIAKARKARWRDGTALTGFLSSNHYATPPRFRSIALRPRLAKALSLGLIGFECAFPLSLVGPRFAIAFIAAGVGFQLVNVRIFGLNRFAWAWAAAYPALYGCSVFFAAK